MARKRVNSYEALLATARDNLSHPLKGIAGHVLETKLRSSYEDAPAQVHSEEPFSYEGGMVDYILTVFFTSLRLRNSLQIEGLPTDHSLLAVSWLHTLDQTIDWNGEKKYVPKILGSGDRSTKVPWMENPKYGHTGYDPKTPADRAAANLAQAGADFIPSGMKTLAILRSRYPEIEAALSDDEKLALRYSGGAYEHGDALRLLGKESPLHILLQAARHLAALGFVPTISHAEEKTKWNNANQSS